MQEKKPCKNLKIRKVSIVGVIPSFAFQRAKYCALELHRKLPQKFPLPEIVGMLELDWSEKLMEWRQTYGREYWCLRRPVAVFFDGTFIGSDIELIKLTSIGNVLFDSVPRKDMSSLKNNFRKDYIAFLKKSKRIYCYLDICVDDVYIGTLTFQLYSDLLPRTCENFKTLCLGSKGSFLTYKGSRIHRIVKKGWLQGGDIQYKSGGGGFSIFCDPLEDEGFGIRHDRKGVLSMATGGRHKNGSQFFITLSSTQWMDTNFVAFGQLIEGSKVLKKLENLETVLETPLNKIEIKSCGKLDLEDIEDIDATYREHALPKRAPKKYETISEQNIRLVMEALTEALARKEYVPDVLDDRDVASKMNIHFYFQGLYSMPEEIVEECARYLRKFRRALLRIVKPSATEIVEVIMYDLLMAVLTRMTTLDDIRETIGHELYQKMLGGINMTLELCKKSYVKKLVDQIATTAESMVTLISKKLKLMKRKSNNLKTFQNRMQAWVQSFVRQETFEGDPYFIAEKRDLEPPKPKEEEKKLPYREGFPHPCCEKENQGDSVEKLDVEDKKRLEKLKTFIPPADMCCLGTKVLSSDTEMTFSKLFSTCRYDLKKITDEKIRLPLLELIELSRFKLRWMRKQENRTRSAERLCLEKKIRKWMESVKYTPESIWIRDTVFEPDEVVFDHVEDIMYGAMTVGLLEMYYFYERYLNLCGAANKKREIVRESKEEFENFESEPEAPLPPKEEEEEKEKETEKLEEPPSNEVFKEESFKGEETEEEKEKEELENMGEVDEGLFEEERVEWAERMKEKEVVETVEKILPECKCGHPCCVCAFDPFYKPTATSTGEPVTTRKKKRRESSDFADEDVPTQEDFGEEEQEEEEETEGEEKEERKSTVSTKDDDRVTKTKPCPSGTELIDLNEIMAETVSLRPEEIDIKSFKWLKSYIMEKGCDLKTEFAVQTHKWLEGDRFNYKGFFSKHSLVTRASLLSLSLSLAEIIKEENKFKSEIRNFIYDLWDLYFNEMFKEALLEFPPIELDEADDIEAEKDAEAEVGYENENENENDEKERILNMRGIRAVEGGSRDKRRESAFSKEKSKADEDPCVEILKNNPDIDLEAFCAKYKEGNLEELLQAEKEEEEKKGKKSEGRDSVASGKGRKGSRASERRVSLAVESERKESVINAKDRKESVVNAKDRKESVINAKDRKESVVNAKDRKESVINAKDRKESVVNAKDRKESVIDAKDRKESVVNAKDRKESVINAKDRKESVVNAKDRKESVINAKDRKESVVNAKDRKESVIDAKDRKESVVNAKDRKESVVNAKDRKESVVNAKERKVSIAGEKEPKEGVPIEKDRKKSEIYETSQQRRETNLEIISAGKSAFTPSPRSTVEDKERSNVNGENVAVQDIPSNIKDGKEAEKQKKQIEGKMERQVKERMREQVKDEQMEGQGRGQAKIQREGQTGEEDKKYEKQIPQDEEPSSEESRSITAYANPFWVTFLTELTKQALSTMAKVSVLPKRLYFKSDTDTDFNEKMKEWFEFNAFNPQPTRGRELIDYIALHHRSLTNLEESARSYLKKKKYSGLINRCTRFSSAESLANEILADVVESAMIKPEGETLELFLSSMISTAVASTPEVNDFDDEEEFEIETDKEVENFGETD